MRAAETVSRTPVGTTRYQQRLLPSARWPTAILACFMLSACGGNNQQQARHTVGGTCSSDSDCQSGLMCAPDPGGHCEKSCNTDPDCGSGGICTSDRGGVGGTCYHACASSADCRPDRRCVGGVAGRKFCDPPSDVGGTCFVDSDCQTSLMCASDPNGHCEKSCATDPECGTGGICTSDRGGVGGTCYHACASSADCRPDRRCVGGVAGRKFCDPPSAVGGTCFVESDCETGLMCAPDPNGHCEKPCATDAECGAGAVCTTDAGGVGGTCYHACMTDADCRPDRHCTGGVAPRLFCN